MRKLSEIIEPILTEAMLSITALGSISVAIIILTVLYRQKEKQCFKNLLTGLLTTNIIVYTIKEVVARPRPETIIPEVMVSTHSFPSGHTATAFLTATILAEKLDSKTIYLIATLIGISRIYTGTHYPTDAITGAIIGFSIGKIVLNKDEIYTKLSETISSTFS